MVKEVVSSGTKLINSLHIGVRYSMPQLLSIR